MKSNFKLGIILLVLVLIFTALMQAGQKEKIDWSISFDPEEKIPFATHILKNEIANILKDNPPLRHVKQPIYEFLEKENYSEQSTIFYITNFYTLGDAANQKIFDFVEKGGTLFLASSRFETNFKDSLKFDCTIFNEFEAGVDIENITSSLLLPEQDQEVEFDKLKYFFTFNQLDKENTTILGYAKKGNVSVPNFIRIDKGNGQIFIHLEPTVFTNYYFLQEEPFSLIYHSLQHLKTSEILWYDDFYLKNVPNTPLRFILTQVELRAAWYILLISLMLYLFFKSKREQRAIDIIEPEQNLSIAFAKTIGSLYYENGNPGNMIEKKIDYFLYTLRKQFHLDTQDILSTTFILNLSQRTNYNKSELIDFFTELKELKMKEAADIDDLKRTNYLIENFKQKANLL